MRGWGLARGCDGQRVSRRAGRAGGGTCWHACLRAAACSLMAAAREAASSCRQCRARAAASMKVAASRALFSRLRAFMPRCAAETAVAARSAVWSSLRAHRARSALCMLVAGHEVDALVSRIEAATAKKKGTRKRRRLVDLKMSEELCSAEGLLRACPVPEREDDDDDDDDDEDDREL